MFREPFENPRSVLPLSGEIAIEAVKSIGKGYAGLIEILTAGCDAGVREDDRFAVMLEFGGFGM